MNFKTVFYLRMFPCLAAVFAAAGFSVVNAYTPQCEQTAKTRLVVCSKTTMPKADCVDVALKNSACRDDEGELRKVLLDYYDFLNSPHVSGKDIAAKTSAASAKGPASAVIVEGRYSHTKLRHAPYPSSYKTTGGTARSVSPARAQNQNNVSKQEQPEESAQTPVVSQKDYQDSIAYAAQAGIKLSLKDYTGALREASLAIAKDPSNRNAYLARAEANSRLKHLDEAISDASHVLESEPLNAAAYNIRAWARAQKGDLIGAKDDSYHAITSDPGMAAAYYNRARIAEKSGQYHQTLEDLREASRIDKSYQSRFRDAVLKYKSAVPDFDAREAGLTETEEKIAATHSGGFLRTGWGRIYIFFGSLAVGALIMMQLAKALRAKRRSKSGGSPSSPPLFVNQFALVRKVGEGGMGEVYEGFDRTLKRKVAIKKLKTASDMTDEAREQFLNEARTVASLHHGNIVDIYSVFESGGSMFLVFEYVEGVTLGDKLDKEGRLPLDEAKTVFKFICRALEYAHSNDIIHRDLKPGNIMISSDRTVKVMDFGIARRADAKTSQKISSGTPAYMSPEQRTGAVRKESDIYSLGICLYETLTGHLPWDLEGVDRANPKIIPPSEIVASLPHGIDKLLQTALEPDPDKRVRSASEFWKTLNSIQ